MLTRRPSVEVYTPTIDSVSEFKWRPLVAVSGHSNQAILGRLNVRYR